MEIVVRERGAHVSFVLCGVALHAKMTVADLLNLDLTYAPPFASVLEGIQLAAQELKRHSLAPE
ncbi:MAG TPA: hypothetical protein VM013_08495 [Dehalococcoidia bacterium]|nr:hypothetical protein [Dehalococcoidia bacterium]